MKPTFLILTIFFQSAVALASQLSLPSNAPTGAIACVSAPAGALTGYRLSLASGGYGFCQIASCDPQAGYEALPVSGKCVLPPTASWFTTSQTLTEAETVFTARAQLNRAATTAMQIPVSSALSQNASSLDYSLPEGVVKFQVGQTLSDPFAIQLHRRAGFQTDRVLVLSLSQSQALTLTIKDSEQNPSDLPLYSISGSPLEVNAGQSTAQVVVNLTKPLSLLFPTKVELIVGGKKMTAIVPAKSLSSQPLSIDLSALSAGSSIAVSATGFQGQPGTIKVKDDNQIPAGNLRIRLVSDNPDVHLPEDFANFDPRREVAIETSVQFKTDSNGFLFGTDGKPLSVAPTGRVSLNFQDFKVGNYNLSSQLPVESADGQIHGHAWSVAQAIQVHNLVLQENYASAAVGGVLTISLTPTCAGGMPNSDKSCPARIYQQIARPSFGVINTIANLGGSDRADTKYLNCGVAGSGLDSCQIDATAGSLDLVWTLADAKYINQTVTAESSLGALDYTAVDARLDYINPNYVIHMSGLVAAQTLSLSITLPVERDLKIRIVSTTAVSAYTVFGTNDGTSYYQAANYAQTFFKVDTDGYLLDESGNQITYKTTEVPKTLLFKETVGGHAVTVTNFPIEQPGATSGHPYLISPALVYGHQYYLQNLFGTSAVDGVFIVYITAN